MSTRKITPRSPSIFAPNYRTRQMPQQLVAEAQKLAQEHVKQSAKKATRSFPKAVKVSFRNQKDCQAFARVLRTKISVEDKEIQFSAARRKSSKHGQFIGSPKSVKRAESQSSDWLQHWRGMPEFEQSQTNWTYHRLTVICRTRNDYAAFANAVRQSLSLKTKSIYYPAWTPSAVKESRWVSSLPRRSITPKYPIYIISKGRANSRLTSKALEAINVPYWIVIEPAEYDSYASVISPEKILKLPYNTDPANPTGPGRAREWCAIHAATEGFKRHWVMDDNISAFYRFNRNRRFRVADGAIFRAAEDFVDRYTNVLVAGFNYRFFVAQKQTYPAFVANTRIYSCLLIDNRFVFELPLDAPAAAKPKVIPRPEVMGKNNFLWRERYNEDTILSLDALWNGYCTIQFNAFLQDKVGTQKMAGGNSEVFYAKEGAAKIKFSGDGRYNPAGTINKSLNLEVCYPEVNKVGIRYNRVHHYVDYSRFRGNALKLRAGARIRKGVNNYGMALKRAECSQVGTKGEVFRCSVRTKESDKVP